MKKRVLISGIGGPAGRSAVAYFTAKGYFVIGMDMAPVEAAVKVFHKVPPAMDTAYAGFLLALIEQDRADLFVPTVTEELLTVARLKQEIERRLCRVFISAPGAVAIANNKYSTYEFMSAHGVPVPMTFDGATPKDAVLKELGLPLLAKPSFGRGGRGVAVYRTQDEFHGDDRAGLVYQEFIPGDEYDVNLFMGAGGDVLSAVALKKTVLKEGIVGNAAEVQRASAPEAVELAKKAATLLKMEGPLDMDIRLRADGGPVLLEINARLGGNVLNAAEVLDSLVESWKKEDI